jgi:hypothetical protein
MAEGSEGESGRRVPRNEECHPSDAVKGWRKYHKRASVSGITAYPEASAYGASKAAVRPFSKVAAIECADAASSGDGEIPTMCE